LCLKALRSGWEEAIPKGAPRARCPQNSSMYRETGTSIAPCASKPLPLAPNPRNRVSGPTSFLLSTVQLINSGHNSRIPYLFFLDAFASFSCRFYQCSLLCSKQRSAQSSLPRVHLVYSREAQIWKFPVAPVNGGGSTRYSSLDVIEPPVVRHLLSPGFAPVWCENLGSPEPRA